MSIKTKRTILLTGLLGLSLTACSTAELTKAQQGAIIGGVTGAIIGKGTSNHDDKRAVIGGAVGAAAGAAIGAYMDKQEQELRTEMQGTGIEIDRQGDNIVLNMPDSITFDTAQSNIKPQFYSTLNTLGSTLTQYDQTRIRIAGHTDSRGSLQYNQELSVNRANSVRAYLQSQNVPPARMYAQGFGETRPIADNNTDIGMAKNRRVEITLIPVQQQTQQTQTQTTSYQYTN